MAGNHNSGRRPTPKALAVYDAIQSRPVSPMPEPPDWLSNAALDEWNRILPELCKQVAISPVDARLLAAYCDLYSQYIDATDILRQDGQVIRIPGKAPRMHPLAKRCLDIVGEMRRLAAEFGFSPMARKRIDAKIEGTEQDELSAFNAKSSG